MEWDFWATKPKEFELKTQPTTRHANIVSAGTQTFDLASVFYDIKSAKCNAKTSEQAKPYAGDNRKTCVKSKRTKDLATNKLTRAGETSHGHLAHQLPKDCTVSIETQPFADRNKIQSQVKAVLTRPTTSKDLNYFHNHNSSNPNYSGNTDYQRTCVKENRLEAQEKSFINTIMEAAKSAAKPSINVNQGQTITEDGVAKGTKRKLTNEIFDQKAVKKGCINYPNNDNRRVQEVSKGKMPANNKFLTENSGPSDKYRNIMAEKVDYRFSWATSNKNPFLCPLCPCESSQLVRLSLKRILMNLVVLRTFSHIISQLLATLAFPPIMVIGFVLLSLAIINSISPGHFLRQP